VINPSFKGASRFDCLTVYTDGAARGNPGHASIGVVIKDESGREVASFGEYIGTATNNLAEYTALVHALRLLSAFEVGRLRLRVDSDLLARQLRGEYRVKEPHLRVLHAQVSSMLKRYADWSVEHVPREENREADAQANRALDAWLDGGRAGVSDRKAGKGGGPQGSLFQ
jgi:ribonuclease HI